MVFREREREHTSRPNVPRVCSGIAGCKFLRKCGTSPARGQLDPASSSCRIGTDAADSRPHPLFRKRCGELCRTQIRHARRSACASFHASLDAHRRIGEKDGRQRIGCGIQNTCKYKMPCSAVYTLNTAWSVSETAINRGALRFFFALAQFYRRLSLFAQFFLPGFLRFAHLILHFYKMVQTHQNLIRGVIAKF